jgi:cytochrome P450
MSIHRCVGQIVAHVEAEIVLTTLARQAERIELTGQPQRKPNNTLRAWSSLPVIIHPASV